MDKKIRAIRKFMKLHGIRTKELGAHMNLRFKKGHLSNQHVGLIFMNKASRFENYEAEIIAGINRIFKARKIPYEVSAEMIYNHKH